MQENDTEELRELGQKVTPDELLDALLDKTGYVRVLEEKNTTEDTARAEAREALISLIAQRIAPEGGEEA